MALNQSKMDVVRNLKYLKYKCVYYAQNTEYCIIVFFANSDSCKDWELKQLEVLLV